MKIKLGAYKYKIHWGFFKFEYNEPYTSQTQETQGWPSTVDVCKRSDIEGHKLVPDCWQPGKFASPTWRNFTSTLAQCYLNFRILSFRLLHSPFSLKLVRRCCGIKWCTWYLILCLKSGHKSSITYQVLKSHRCTYIYIYIYTLNYIKYSHMHNIYIGKVRKYMYI